MKGVKFDQNKNCWVNFDQYAQLYKDNNPANSQADRTARDICFGPEGKLKVGLQVLDICTVCKITLQIYTTLPIPSLVINKLNKIVISEGKTSILTFYYWKGNTIGDNTENISGVDVVPDIASVD